MGFESRDAQTSWVIRWTSMDVPPCASDPRSCPSAVPVRSSITATTRAAGPRTATYCINQLRPRRSRRAHRSAYQQKKTPRTFSGGAVKEQSEADSRLL